MADDAGKPARIIVWTVPRSVSTAFTKCLSFIDRIEVWLAPYHYCTQARNLYWHDWGESPDSHAEGEYPSEFSGNEAVFTKAATLLSGFLGSYIEPERIAFSEVKRKLENARSRYVLVKDSVACPPDQHIKACLPEGFKHVFLIRDPILVFNSYRRAEYDLLKANNHFPVDAMNESEFDVEKHTVSPKRLEFSRYMHELWGHVRERVDPDPIVINSQDLLDDPKRLLTLFCELTGLPYRDSLLRWEGSTDVVDKWKAPGDDMVHSLSFYRRAITSSQFLPSRKPIPRDQLTDDVTRLADASLPYYDDMNQHRLR